VYVGAAFARSLNRYMAKGMIISSLSLMSYTDIDVVGSRCNVGCDVGLFVAEVSLEG
jgi:hypothetical protein